MSSKQCFGTSGEEERRSARSPRCRLMKTALCMVQLDGRPSVALADVFHIARDTSWATSSAALGGTSNVACSIDLTQTVLSGVRQRLLLPGLPPDHNLIRSNALCVGFPDAGWRRI